MDLFLPLSLGALSHLQHPANVSQAIEASIRTGESIRQDCMELFCRVIGTRQHRDVQLVIMTWACVLYTGK